MKGNYSEIRDMVVRYLLIAVVSLFGLSYLNKLLSAFTITSLTGLLRYFYDEVIVMSVFIYVDGQGVEIVRECVMGIIYWILFILVFSTAKIKWSRRLAALFMAGTMIFVFNLARMVLLISIAKTPYFNGVHELFQYIVPLWLFAVWMITVRLLKIQSIPVYSDVMCLYNLARTRGKHG